MLNSAFCILPSALSDLDDQFAALAVPLFDERLVDNLVLHVAAGGTVNFRGVVHRMSDVGPHQTTVSGRGRDASESVQIQVVTPNVFPGPDDAIALPDGSLAQVIRQIGADPSGEFPLIACHLPRGITSKHSRARP